MLFFSWLSEVTLVRPPDIFPHALLFRLLNHRMNPKRHMATYSNVGFTRSGRLNHLYLCEDQTRRFKFLTAEVIYWYLAIVLPLHKDTKAHAIFFFFFNRKRQRLLCHFQETQGQIFLEPDWKWEKFTVCHGSINAIHLIKAPLLFILATFEVTLRVHWFL